MPNHKILSEASNMGTVTPVECKISYEAGPQVQGPSSEPAILTIQKTKILV